jgi:hypothetical protein
MKSNSLGIKLLMTAVCLAVLAYFGVQVYLYFNDPLMTAVAYSYQVEEGATVSGWVVRQEQVLSGQSTGVLRLSRSEGEKVSKGGQIAVIYADQSSLDRQNEIDALETQIEQLQYATESALNSEAALKLDNQIMTGILALRSDVTAHRLDYADSHISELRSLVLKRDYTYSGGDAEAQLTELQARLKALQSQAAASTRAVTAPVSGIYSAVVDGYETVLTPACLEELTPSALNNIQPEGTVSDLGKLITGTTWYYAASMAASDAAALTVGKSVTLRFVKGSERDLTMQVTSLSREENGRVAAVFSSSQFLTEMTLLRQQSADIITNTITGIRVPSEAIRTEKVRVDTETGESTTEQRTGLYCVVGLRARFKPVEVVYTGADGYVLVRAADGADSTTTLRSGDEVIITANHLYDGKVVS